MQIKRARETLLTEKVPPGNVLILNVLIDRKCKCVGQKYNTYTVTS